MHGFNLSGGRSAAIDIFRAMTVLVMITVNEWHGVVGLPAWMLHMPADADAMSFVDMVFPAFLFIVGMSVPFALQQRLQKGDSMAQLLSHMLQRGLGLVVMGVFMVNAEEGFNPAAMPMPIALWALLSYAAAFAVWGSLRGGPALPVKWRVAGAALFLLLAWLYRAGVDGRAGMATQWWGILGLIGWAYLLACACVLLCRARPLPLLLCMLACMAYFMLHRLPAVESQGWLKLLFSQDGNAVHGGLALCGSITALIFFDPGRAQGRRHLLAMAFALWLALLAGLLRPAYKISKIYATPSWALYSAAACVLIFAALQAWSERRAAQPSKEAGLLAVVAANPLLAYLTPFIIGALLQLLNLAGPAWLRSGWPGVLWPMAYALGVACWVRCIAARGVRLRI